MEPWNHNIHYFDALLAAAPQKGVSALDVGCGDGVLTLRLQQLLPNVIGIDADLASIRLARQRDKAHTIDFISGDFLGYPFEDESFDFITCSMALHHMPVEQALGRMADLLRPGGVLAILGIARTRYPVDLARDAAGFVANWLYLLTRRHWESPAPIRPPAHTYREIRTVAEQLLPRHRFRRYLLWRYSIIWAKPSRQVQTG